MKKTSKFIAILLTLALIFSFAGCAKKEEAAPASDPAPAADTNDDAAEDDAADDAEETEWVWDGEKYDDLMANMGKADVDLSNADGLLKSVLDKGVLVIGTSPDYPPAEFVDMETGEIKGNEILLAKYIANSLGVELEVETMDFSAILAAADTNKIDLAISGFGYKEDRAEQYELSHGYQSSSAAAHHSIDVLAKDLDKYNSLEDFNKEGLVIDAQANSLQQMYVEDQLPNANLQLVTSIDQSILELLAGKIDAVALDSTTGKNYAEQSNGQIVSVFVEKGIEFDLSLYSDYAGNVCAVKKGETSMINAINEIIDQLLAQDGLYSTWYYASCDAAGVVPGEDE